MKVPDVKPAQSPQKENTTGATLFRSNRREFLGSVGAAAVVGSGSRGLAQPAAPGIRDGLVGPVHRFQSARPVWVEGRTSEMNLQVGFRTFVNFQPQLSPDLSGPVLVRIAASSLYRLSVNGFFVGHGPARAAHGFFRIDEWEIPEGRLKRYDNLVAVEVAGYNVNSYYLLNQPAFLQAEVVWGDQTLAATGPARNEFEAFPLEWRVQKTQRYSFQRTFSEVYRLRPEFDLWKKERKPLHERKSPVTEAKAGECLPRRVPSPGFHSRQPVLRLSRGRFRANVAVEKPWKDRALTGIGKDYLGYPEDQLEIIQSLDLQKTVTDSITGINEAYAWEQESRLGTGEFEIYDFGVNNTGFFGCRVECSRSSRLYLTFDEILSDGDVDFRRLSCVNAVVWELEPGEYELESFEPYTLQYLKVMCFAGDCRIDRVYLRELVNSDVHEAHFSCSDDRLNRLFAAARETFRQNAVDIFMDCPSRERAGWLCDSFFTSRVASVLSGNLSVEKNFLENYLLPDSFANMPAGMVPMCYPADHYNGEFIPNWSLWFVLQLREYLQRSADDSSTSRIRSRLTALFDYFRKFENDDGLLEKLESWVFIEWSAANDFVQDVNYPSNMLYAAALEAAGQMLPDESMLRRAEEVRKAIRKQSFDGEFFVDNAVRGPGGLRPTRNRTEVCQYFAFYFGVADSSTYPELWNRLATEFGPDRVSKGHYPEIHPANSFVGNVLRLELLSRYGLGRQMLDESVSYLLYMADRTGTLWENTDTRASCDHGFASHVSFTYFRDVLGCYRIDHSSKQVLLRPLDLDLAWAEGRIPGPGEPIEVRWQRDGHRLDLQAVVPAGYRVEVENPAGLEIRLNS